MFTNSYIISNNKNYYNIKDNNKGLLLEVQTKIKQVFGVYSIYQHYMFEQEKGFTMFAPIMTFGNKKYLLVQKSSEKLSYTLKISNNSLLFMFNNRFAIFQFIILMIGKYHASTKRKIITNYFTILENSKSRLILLLFQLGIRK